jgi:hypothetical protein
MRKYRSIFIHYIQITILIKKKMLKVVGVSFNQDNLHECALLHNDRSFKVDVIKYKFIHPTNPKLNDPTAKKVIYDDLILGHLPRNVSFDGDSLTIKVKEYQITNKETKYKVVVIEDALLNDDDFFKQLHKKV